MFPLFEDRKEDLSVSVAVGVDYPEHLHGHVEMLYVRSGTQRMRIQDETLLLCAGDLAVVFPNTIHAYTGQDGDCDGVLLIALPSLCVEYQHALQDCVPKKHILRQEELHEDVAFCMTRLLEETDEAVHKAFLHLLLCRVIPMLSPGKGEPGDADLLTRAVRFICAGYTQPLTLGGVSRQLGVNPYYLSHLFTSRLGMGFRGYLNALRIAQARQLLRHTQHTVTHICFECGFENLRTFDRVFAAHVGCSPRAFRGKG